MTEKVQVVTPHLVVDNANAAIDFYKKYGFVIEKEVPVKMGPFDFKDFVMTKVL